MKRRSLLAFLLLLILCLAACGGGPDGNGGEQAAPREDFPAAAVGTGLGDGIADFTFTAYDGKTYSLYETLEEKKMVLINLWASWCGPCRAEFPYMQTAYEAYQDDVEIFALSCEAGDTSEVLRAYAESMGLTFPVGRDTPKLLEESFRTGSVPTSVVVDRFGVICFIASGAVPSQEAFQQLFDVFTAEDYTESVLLPDGLPAKRPDVEPEDPAELAAVLGEGLTYVNPDGGHTWPLALEDGCAASTNAAQSATVSALHVELAAAAGDVFAVDYAVSSEAGFDFMTISVNGEVVKCASGQQDWSTAFYTFEEAGDYTVEATLDDLKRRGLAYEKDGTGDGGSDGAYFKNVRLLSGDEAATLRASLPVCPYAAETTLTVTSPGAEEVVISDPSGALESAFGDARWYIIPGPAASFSATLAEGLNAGCASFLSGSGGSAVLSDCVADGKYVFTVSEPTGIGYAALLPSMSSEPLTIFFFNGEANLNAFLARNFTGANGVLSATWKYASGAAPASTAGADALEEGKVLYYLVFVDQDGAPVEGVTVNICDDSSCTPMQSGANGVAAFAYPPFGYHVQVLQVPDGYEYDLSTETYLSEEGGVTELVVNKK